MTTLTLELPAELVARLEEVANETGRPLDTLVTEALSARFVPSPPAPSVDAATAGEHIRLRQVRLVGWPADATFRREEIYGDDTR